MRICRYAMLVAGCWMLDAGFDKETNLFEIQYPEASISLFFAPLLIET